MKRFTIDHRNIGQKEPCFVVAEVGLAHDGNLETAFRFVDVAAAAGVDAVKFQTHLAEFESTAREPFRVKFSSDRTRYDYWKRTAFSLEQWQRLAAYVREKSLLFLSSPFSEEAVEWLEQCEVPAWKVASGEISNVVLLEKMIATGKPILLSSGMSSWDELDQAVALIQNAGLPLMIYQCTTSYPCPPEKVGLGTIPEINKRYDVPVGLSDHSGTPWFGIAATALGASSIEVHIIPSTDAVGPDARASLDPKALTEMVRGIRAVEASIHHPLDKDRMAQEYADLRTLFGRSIVAQRPLKVGHILQREDITLKKPGGGLPPAQFKAVIGRQLKRDLDVDEALQDADLDFFVTGHPLSV